MPKKIFIGESDLLKIKNAMAGNNISHSNSIVENDVPPYEADEFEIGGEGNFFHIEKAKVNENTFEKWFGNSVLKDENGNPIKMYHGTDAQFDAFSKDFIGSTGAFEGYGFNFTPHYSSAAHYNSKNVIEAYLRVENPMTTKTNNITLRTLCEVIKELDKGKDYTETVVAAYETPRYGEKWDERYYRRALPIAAKKIYEYNKENGYGDAGIYAEISLNGQADAKDVIRVFEGLGYDAAIHYDNYDKIQTVVVFEPNQIKLVTNKTYNNDSEIMSENIESEVEANEVKLDSFKKRETLAPKIWDGFDLNPKVRLKLLDIADDFWEFVNLTWVKRKGIYLTGSICNFNWSKHSDIDMHIVVDFSDVDEREDFVQDYFNSKKDEWNTEHSKLKIYGFQVELYVENVNAETESGGIYDLEDNSWVKKPNSDNIKPIGLDKYTIKDKSAELMTKVDDLYDKFKVTDDDAELRAIGNEASDILDGIKKMRKVGLKRGGESDQFNIVYKVLRRAGYIDKLWNLKSSLYDKLNSITEINEGVLLEYLENWVLNNLPQYRNQIMFGKNGRSLKEEVVADGNASHNPFKQKWKHEREVLKNYLVNYGEIMTSKENGKEYKVLYDTMLSSRLGISYCICIQWNSMEMRPGNVIYVRAFDKFTRRRFKPQFDTRGFDNIEGTADDLA